MNVKERLDKIEAAILPSNESSQLVLQLVDGDGTIDETRTYNVGEHGGVRETRRMARNGTSDKS